MGVDNCRYMGKSCIAKKGKLLSKKAPWAPRCVLTKMQCKTRCTIYLLYLLTYISLKKILVKPVHLTTCEMKQSPLVT